MNTEKRFASPGPAIKLLFTVMTAIVAATGCGEAPDSGPHCAVGTDVAGHCRFEPEEPKPTAVSVAVPSTVEVEQACQGIFDVSAPFFDANDLDASEFVEFVPDGARAIVRGVLGPDDPDKLRTVLESHPEIRTLVLTNVPGTIAANDATLELVRLVREANLATCVPSDGYIASGAVDLFLAGSVRMIFGRLGAGGACTSGAACAPCGAGDTCVGVHDWHDVEGGFDGRDLSTDHPRHRPFLDLLAELGVDESFYWYRINAAPFDGIYFMSREDLAAWGVETKNACSAGTATPVEATCHTPPGTFTESCRDCFLDETFLSCNCNDAVGVPQATSLDVSACAEPVSNCDGALSCDGECPSPGPVAVAPTEIMLADGFANSTGVAGNPAEGQMYRDVCPDGHAVTGLRGDLVGGDYYIGSIEPTCSKLEIVEHGAGSYGIVTTEVSELPRRGSGYGSAISASCPVDQVVVGFSHRAGDLIDQVTMLCAPLQLALDPGSDGYQVVVGEASAVAPFGGSGGSQRSELRCAEGEIATDVNTSVAIRWEGIEGFHFGCRKIELL